MTDTDTLSETTTMTARATQFVISALRAPIHYATLIIIFIMLVAYVHFQCWDLQPKPKSCYPTMGLRVANAFDLAS